LAELADAVDSKATATRSKTPEKQAKRAGKDQTFPGPFPIVPPDADLSALIDAWPKLPAAIRAGIVAMAKAAKG
jgi:hypothetical protein